MKYTNTPIDQKPRKYIVLDLESAVLDDVGHRRYQVMERWRPQRGQPSRRNYKRSEDPLQTPRWPFQSIVTISAMVMIEHPDGGIGMTSFETWSAAVFDELGMMQGLLDLLCQNPGAEIISWGGAMHDLCMIRMAVMRLGLTLPTAWRWLAFGYSRDARHLDLQQVVTGGFKMKPIHQAEVLAALNLPGKITAAPFAIARLIYARNWKAVREACECDVISTALMFAHWRQMHDGRTEIGVVVDRILRDVIERHPAAGYVPALRHHRQSLFEEQQAQAASRIPALAPWLGEAA
ncbi:hypothetical protein LWE61_12420 [Sphingobium sufflavum]|uniref:hypothetical protein n=1 Tax=Sphingobium sufflavum TaxID=1129547 RepID=UPI001F3758FA|nr:hypothetical protein [Sphingobium sufflavum]MCE7797360.1 hypothetical protein [Sphingobium sufflavum]